MSCSITNITFGQSGQDAIKEIRQKTEAANMLGALLGGSVFVSIFSGNGMLHSSWNITQNDWSVWSEAMSGVPKILKNRIRLIAYAQVTSPITTQEREFWEGVAHGCD